MFCCGSKSGGFVGLVSLRKGLLIVVFEGFLAGVFGYSIMGLVRRLYIDRGFVRF